MILNSPWFVAKDVCGVLGYSNARTAKRHCKGVSETRTPSPGGPQNMTIIPESDLYRLVIHSRLPQAEEFEKWVMEVVLPAIRKTGGYVQGEEHGVLALDDDERGMQCIPSVGNRLINESFLNFLTR